jgi:hypothetical protein
MVSDLVFVFEFAILRWAYVLNIVLFSWQYCLDPERNKVYEWRYASNELEQ